MAWKRLLLKFGVVSLVVAGLFLLLMLRPRGDSQLAAEAEVWTCSMHPQIRLPNPGNCPICGMTLIPISQLHTNQENLVQSARLETEVVRRHELFKEIRSVGKLDYSERQVELITARIAGRVDRLFVDFTGLNVKKGDHLVEIYSPELNVVQNELLTVLESREKEMQSSPSGTSFAESMLESSRTKLRLLGILDEQIQAIETTRKTTTHLTIYAPLGGTVIEKNVRVGQYVAEGDLLYRIANLDPIWLYLNIYEYDIASLRIGQPAEVILEAYPGETFHGSVTFIDPFLDDASRTIRVRVNLKNPDFRLKPEMYATAIIHVPLRADGSPEPTGLEGKYICRMHPEIVQVDSGRCPICEMPLERVPELSTVASPSFPQAEISGRNAKDVEHEGHAGHEGHAMPPKGETPTVAEKSTAKQAENDAEVESKRHGMPEEKAEEQSELAIPVTAVLDTGRRQITYRRTNEGAFELVELKLGPRAQATDDSGEKRDYYLVLDGLQAGDEVVSRSGFLLDSQRQIDGMPSLLYPTGQAGTMSGHAEHGRPPAKSLQKPAASPPATKMPAGHQH